MSAETVPPTAAPAADAPAAPSAGSRPKRAARTSLLSHGEPAVWLTGGALALALVMILGLLAFIFIEGAETFWPSPVVQVRTFDGKVYLGEATREETFRPTADAFADLPPDVAPKARAAVEQAGGLARRRLYHTGNFDLTGSRFQWVEDFEIAEESRPDWALTIERQAWGNFYGVPAAFLVDGQVQTTDPAETWAKFNEFHPAVRDRLGQRIKLERDDIGAIDRRENAARLAVKQAELDSGAASPAHAEAQKHYEEVKQQGDQESQRVNDQIAALNKENDRYQLRMMTADGREKDLKLADVVRAYPANRLTLGEKWGVYGSRWWEFVAGEPREANTEGGVFPAIWGTVAMTLLLSLLVVPFGVLAALYLREYAKSGPIISAVRIAINNLAGVPSIVFGVFGLGFFAYIVGGSIDQVFFRAELPSPTFGTGGLLWASLTLALLTLPVVIVSTEEALAAVPNSMREGSYACGASKWQTIRRIVLPRAMPGIMTGTILAMARGAGEVAPLMLVGAVKLAQDLPIDGVFPYVHANRAFMHLGFHIYDVGFQSPDSEAARPMVFTTTLLLIAIVAALNVAAVWLRARLRRRFLASPF